MISLSEKTIERILFVAHLIPRINILNLRASVYFADLTSVKRIGRMVANDSYLPLLNGPMPLSLFLSIKDRSFEDLFVFENSTATAKRRPRSDLFSKSDLRFLEFAALNYGKMELPRLRVAFSADKSLTIFGRTLGSEIGLREMVEALDLNGDLSNYVNGK